MTQKVFGVLLILAGAVLLAVNFDLVGVWLLYNLISLWPLALIAAGASYLLSDRPGTATGIVLAIAVGGLAWAFAAGPQNGGQVTTATFSEVLSERTESAAIELDFGAGRLVVGPLEEESSLLAEADLDYTGTPPAWEVKRIDERDVLSIRQQRENFRGWRPGVTRRNWSVRLTPRIPLSLDVDCGAADLRLDLRRLQMNSLELDGGAMSARIYLGEPQDELSVALRTGASKIHLEVPRTVGVKVVWKSALSSNNLEGEGLQKTAEDTFATPGYETSAKRISIAAEIGVSDFTLRRR